MTKDKNLILFYDSILDQIVICLCVHKGPINISDISNFGALKCH